MPGRSIVVPVRAACDRERGAGLERRDAGDGPSAQGILPPTCPRSRHLLQINDGQPVRAIEIAHSTIHASDLWFDGADAGAGAVDVFRPAIRRRQLESTRKAPIYASLQGMIRGVPLAGSNVGCAEVGIKARHAPTSSRGFQSALVVNRWLSGTSARCTGCGSLGRLRFGSPANSERPPLPVVGRTSQGVRGRNWGLDCLLIWRSASSWPDRGRSSG